MEPQNSILKSKYPAKAHCAKVASHLQSAKKITAHSIIYLEGQKERLQEDNDEPQPFRQRRSFFYLTGCALPDCHLTYDISTSTLTLFIPDLDPDSVIWSGLPLLPPDALKKYDIDACLPNSSLPEHLQNFANNDPQPSLYIKSNQQPPTGANGSKSQPLNTNNDLLHRAIDICRITKDPYELALLRHANAITAAAHTAVLSKIKSGTATNEQDFAAVFTERCLALGAKKQAYTGIFGSGENAATLHYLHNDEPVAGRKNLLVDAAAEWECYCADVTRTVPLKGKFDAESRAVYGIVEKMQAAAMKMLRAGVRWEDVHVRAHEVAVEGLVALGILKGGSMEVLMQERISVAFFPHGLGHYLGLDTHDVGGEPDYGDSDGMFRYLRIRGRIPEGGVVTVEPGIYFCRFIVEPLLKDERKRGFIDEEVLERYWSVGGVRIEDDVLVTKDGYENLTTAPKTIADLEAIMAG